MRLILITCATAIALTGCGWMQRIAGKDTRPDYSGVPMEELPKKPAPSETAPTPVPPEGLQCAAGSFLDQVGQPAAGLRFPESTRVIAPGQMVTMDYVPTRMNVYTDENGVIARVACG